MLIIRRSLFAVLLVVAGVAQLLAFNVPDYTIVKETSGWRATALVVNYTSVNGDCSGTETLSGLITIPSSMKATAIVLDNHYTMTKNSEVPSEAGSAASATLFEGTMVMVAPDYLGYGYSVSKEHPYLCHHQNATSCIDLVRVARDIIARRGVALELDALFNFGYSQGGGVAMAVHREMELDKELAQELHFVKSFCGAGPYDLTATLEADLAQGMLEQPCLLPLVIKGLLAGFPQYFAEGRTFADFFRPELIAAGLDQWISAKNLSTDEISKKMLKVSGNDHSVWAFMAEELKAEQSPLMEELKAVAQADVMFNGWKPSYPLSLFHQPSDELVPFVNTQRAIEALGLDESEQTIVNMGMSHSDYGLMFYLLASKDMLTELERLRNSGDGYYLSVSPLSEDDIVTPVCDLQGHPVGPDYHGIAIRGNRKVMMK